MKENELRIGNLVKLNTDEVCDCYEVDTWVFEANAFNLCEPIPLTEEWLVKFGFHEQIGFIKFIGEKFKDKSFEYAITNATIHHIDLPHKAITELYRVAIRGVLIIESNDSFTMRLATKLKLAEEFEVSSINKDKNSGGLLDTAIPNYVYRWNEKEILKLLKSFDPKNINFVNFDYASDLTNFRNRDNYIENVLLKILIITGKIFFFFFKKQQNCMSIFIDKTKIKKRWPNKNY